ncbi:MAG TPA: peptidoglycan recognition family protein [Tepidisphaeraceae bacterium]|jgi:hypothetical protein
MMRILALGLSLMLLAATESTTTSTVKISKPETVTREQWGSDPQPIPDDQKHTPKIITIHHAGTPWKDGADPAKFVKAVQGWGQRERNWPDLPYHFMIAPDGRIFEARPLEYAPQSNTKYDLPGHVGVELMGSFEVERVNEAQLSSLVKLVAWLCDEYKLKPEEIGGHKDRAKGQTTCPGKDFYRYIEDGTIRQWVEESLAGKTADVKLKDELEGGPTKMIGGVAATQPANQ